MTPLTSETPRARRGSRSYFANLLIYSANLYLLVLALYLIARLIYRDGLWWLAFFNNFTVFYFLGVVGVIGIGLLTRSHALLLRAVPFALIGLAWFGPYFLPRAAATPSPDMPTLRLITFNLWAGNTQIDRVYTWMRAQSPGILFTQETLRDGAGLYDNLTELGADYEIVRGEVLTTSGWGSVSQSRFPVLRHESLAYAERSQRLVIDFAEREIALYNIHFNVPIGGRPNLDIPIISRRLSPFFYYNDEARDSQITALLAQLDAEPLPYIVAGDFNMSDQAALYPLLAARMTDSFREAGNGLGLSWSVPRYRGERLPLLPPQVRIDYVFHSGHFTTLEAFQGPYLGSDHLPLVVTLGLRPDAR